MILKVDTYPELKYMLTAWALMLLNEIYIHTHTHSHAYIHAVDFESGYIP